MKKLLALFLFTAVVMACNNEAENKTDKEKSEAAEAADTTGLIDKAQEKANEAVDTLQSKGGKLIEAAGDTLKKKVIEPFKKDVKKVGEKINETVDHIKEKVKQQ